MVLATHVIIPPEPVPSLTRWGASAHADLVYRTLATLGAQSATELGRSLDVPVRQVQTALDELHCLAAAMPVLVVRHNADRVWRSASPASVVPSLRNRQIQLAKARHRLERQLSILDNIGGSLEGVEGIRPLPGRLQVRARIGELTATQCHEHLVTNPKPAYDAAAIKAAAPTDRALCMRGIKALTLGVPAGIDDESGPHTREMISYGMQYRELPTLPTKLMVLDRTTALLPMDPLNPAKGMWEISNPAIIDRLVAFFMQLWSRSDDPDLGWIPPMTLTQRERAIVARLAAGDTDAAVAAKLDLSVRTIAYTLSNLMERLGVSNRFQLGLVLGSQTTSEMPEPVQEKHAPR